MKKIVLSCKSITEEVEKLETHDLSPIKSNLSLTLTNLMNLAKIHATGPTPTSSQNISITTKELDSVILELVNACKKQDSYKLTELVQKTENSTSFQSAKSVSQLKVIFNFF